MSEARVRQLCEFLVQIAEGIMKGTVNREVLQEFVENIKKTYLRKLFEKVLGLARQSAARIDPKYSARAQLQLEIAKISHNPEDLEQARQSASKIDEEETYWRAKTLADIAGFSQDPNDFEVAKMAADRQGIADLRAEVQITIAGFSHETEDLEKARKRTDEVGNAYFQAHRWIDIAKISKELEDLNRARESAAKVDDWLAVDVQVKITKFSQEPADIEQARKMAAGFKDAYARAKAWTIIASFSHNAEDFKQAREVVSKIDGDDSLSEARKELAMALVEAGDIEQARKVLDELTDEYSFRGDDVQIAIVKASLESKNLKHLEQARQTADKIREPHKKAKAQTIIASFSHRTEDFEKARQVLAGIFSETLLAEAQENFYKALVESLLKRKEFEQACGVAAGIIPDCLRAKLQIIIAKYLAEAIK